MSASATLLGWCQGTLRAARLDGQCVLCDAGAARALRGVGGAAQALRALGCAAVLALPPRLGADAAELAAARAALAAWERAGAAAGTSAGGAEDGAGGQRAVRVTFLFSDALWGREELVGALLSAPFASGWVSARVLTCVPFAAHAGLDGHAAALDPVAFALRAQQLARPNAAEVRVEAVEAGLVCLHVDGPVAGRGGAAPAVFSLGCERARAAFPATLARLQLLGRRGDVEDCDGNADLPAAAKSELKLVARLLACTLRSLGLEVANNLWAQGLSSRLVGNAVLDFDEELQAEQLRAGTGADVATRRATLVIVDRTLDLAAALRADCDDVPLLASTEAALERARSSATGSGDAAVLREAEALLGPLAVDHCGAGPAAAALIVALAHDSPQGAVQHLLRAFGSGSASAVPPSSAAQCIALALADAIERDPCYLDRLAALQVAAAAAAAAAAGEPATARQAAALERVLLRGEEQSHLLLPLVDLVTRGGLKAQGGVGGAEAALRLALLGCARVGAAGGLDPGVEAAFEGALGRALAEEGRGIVLGDACCEPEHILAVLREVRSSRGAQSPFALAGETLLGCVARLARAGQQTTLQPLGGSALAAAASGFGSQARQLFGALGLGSQQQQQRALRERFPYRLSLKPGDTLVLFVVGGCSLVEAREAAQALDGAGVTLIVGGTCLATPAYVMRRTMEQLPDNFAPRNEHEHELTTASEPSSPASAASPPPRARVGELPKAARPGEQPSAGRRDFASLF